MKGQSVRNSIVFGDVIQVQADGDVVIERSRAPYRVTEFPGPSATLSLEQAVRQPSRLLHARYAVVPFQGRDDVLRHLTGWLAGPDPVAIHLLHGPGGQGKSRLAAEFARRSRQSGWQVWRADHGAEPGSSTVPLPAAGRGLLVVVDYADRWPAGDLEMLVRHLQSVAARTGAIVRVLLLARAAGFWWSVAGTGFDAGTEDIRLDALSGPAGRDDQFRQARDAFARALGRDADLIEPPAELAGNDFTHVLAVHMAALVAVDATITRTGVPTSAPGISEYLLHRERAYWSGLGLRTDPATLGRTVFAATFVGALPPRQAVEALIAADLARDHEHARRILDDHTTCYPPELDRTVLEPLHPDRLGEDFLALTLPGARRPTAFTDAWSAEVPRSVLNPNAVTVLIETAHRWPHVARDHLFPMLRAEPQLAAAAGGAALVRLATVPEPDHEVLGTVGALIAESKLRGFEAGLAAIATVLAPSLLDRAKDDWERAELRFSHAEALSRAGRYDDALPLYRAAARYFEGRPDLRPFLAETLISESEILARAGRHAEALGLAEEAVAHARRAAADDDGHTSLLAKCLNLLGARLEDSGRLDRALAIVEEGAALVRGLGEDSLNLAVHEMTLGSRLLDVGRSEESLAVTEDALRLLRRLAADDSRADYDAEIAIALNNVAAVYLSLGRHHETDRTNDELLEIRRRLAAVDPVNYAVALGGSLNNVASTHLRRGRFAEGVALAGEAVAVLREHNPPHAPALLGQALTNYASALYQLKRFSEALAAGQEAADVLSRPAVEHNPALRADRAKVCISLASIQSALGRTEEAFETSGEAVSLLRALPAGSSEGQQPWLALALMNRGKLASDRDRIEDATRLTAEAIALYRELPGQRSFLAQALTNQCMNFSQAGRMGEAIPLGEEAVILRRELAADNPGAERSQLADALAAISAPLLMADRTSESKASRAEALRIYEELAAEQPRLFAAGVAEMRERFALLAEVERRRSGPSLLVATAVRDRLGNETLQEAAASLQPVDCQTCGRPLEDGRSTLCVDDFGISAAASLHHPQCRASEWRDAGDQDVTRLSRAAAVTTWTARSMVVPVAASHGRTGRVPAVIVNPGLEQVELCRSPIGTWQVRPNIGYAEAGLSRAGDLHSIPAAPGVRARVIDGSLVVDAGSWPRPFAAEPFDSDPPVEWFLLFVTYALDPGALKERSEVLEVMGRLTDHRTVAGWVRVTA